jgi:hypothetical protein
MTTLFRYTASEVRGPGGGGNFSFDGTLAREENSLGIARPPVPTGTALYRTENFRGGPSRSLHGNPRGRHANPRAERHTDDWESE